MNKRKEKTGEFTNFDSMEIEFHQKIRLLFHELKKLFPERIHIINADQSAEAVFNDVWNILCSKNLVTKNLS